MAHLWTPIQYVSTFCSVLEAASDVASAESAAEDIDLDVR